MHVWLPEAHPAAPSHISAVMSGVMIKTGIYGIVRIVSFLGCPPAWWGWTLVAMGAASGILGILFALAQRGLHPHLAVIDGFEGMEGNGPTMGKAVEHRVMVAGTDWLAADRVAVELMGIDFANVGYLNYCASAGMGQADLNKIEVLGEPIVRHIRKYKMSDSIDKQLIWMKPAG